MTKFRTKASSGFLLLILVSPLSTPNFIFAAAPKILKSDLKTQIAEVLFTCRATANAKQVFLAGSFNSWAENQSGVVRNHAYLMELDAKTGLYTKKLPLALRRHAYKFVEESADGNFNWFADPHIEERDKDGNSIIDLKNVKPVLVPSKNLRWQKKKIQGWPPMKEQGILIPSRAFFLPTEKICFKFDANFSGEKTFRILHPLGNLVFEKKINIDSRSPTGQFGNSLRGNGTSGIGTILCSDSPLPVGSYIAQIWDKQELLAEEVTSVVHHPSEDVRYGFYAQWDKVVSTDEYARRGEMFLKTHINAVQFYDWFPAHGDYTPDREVFEFDPFFGKKLFLKDIQGKIDGLRKYRIAPIAYVAPYAASKSVYKNFPYPMRYEDGSVRVFSEGGRQESEESAKKNNRAVWFYLMSIHRGSPWRRHILNELAGALKFGFEGFHVDSYGHGKEEKYFGTYDSPHSPLKKGVDAKQTGYVRGVGEDRGVWNGKRMAEVLADLVDEIREASHRLQPQSLVTFNSVNEFALEEMCSPLSFPRRWEASPSELHGSGDKVDFAFVENWAGHSSYLDELAGMTFQGKRLVVALYPKDAEDSAVQTGAKPDVWSPETLRMILAATQAGGGSLIVLGEPSPTGFNSLSDLYYPNFKPLPAKSVKLIHDFYHFDQLMFGLTHGNDVKRKEVETLPYPEVLAYEFVIPVKPVPEGLNRGAGMTGKDEIRSFTLFRAGENKKWTENSVKVRPLKNITLGFRGTAQRAYFATPENQSYRNPVEVPFQSDGKNTWVKIPEFQTFAVVILR